MSPSLRFPEFTGEWENKRIGDIGKFFSGGTPSSSRKDFYGGEIPFIRSGEIHSDKTELFLTQEGYKNSSAKMVEVGDILLALYGANSGDISISQMRGAINQAILCIRTNVAPVFFKSVWEKHAQKILNTYLQGGQGNLSADIVKKITISIPSQIEQAKIAALFSHLDERISIQNRLIDRLQSLMKGIRHRIINEAKGKIVCLCEVSDIYQPQTISSADLTETGYPVYGANGIIGHYTSYNHEAEQVCITCRGNTCGGVNYTKSKSWITGNAMVVNVDRYQNIVSKRYLYHYLSNCDFNSIISGSGQPQIVRAPLAKFKIILPTVMQQYKIAHCLDVIQNKINVNSNILNLLIRQKQYLLRKMFI